MKRLLPRTLLVKKLSEAFRRKLCTVEALAGYGKTTLLKAFMAQHPKRQISYYALSPQDKSLIFFIGSLCRCVRTFYAEFGEALLYDLGKLNHTISTDDAAAIGDRFARALNDGVDDDLVLILDDVHLAEPNPALRAFLRMAVERSDALSHFVLASRGDAGIERGIFRARGELVELTQDDLRFSDMDLRDLLRLKGVDLAPDLIYDLYRKTQGWTASVTMALDLLEKKSLPEQREFIVRLEASPKLHEFILQEVYARLPPDLQPLCELLSLPESFDVRLGNAITRRAAMDKELEALVGRNLLTEQQGQYRFHSLVRAFLAAKLSAEVRQQGAERCAAFYENAGRTADAIEFYLLAENGDAALRLIERRMMTEKDARAARDSWLIRLADLRLNDDALHRVMCLSVTAKIDYEQSESLRSKAAEAYQYFSTRAHGTLHHLYAARLVLLFQTREGNTDAARATFTEIISLSAPHHSPEALYQKVKTLVFFGRLTGDLSMLEEAFALARQLGIESLETRLLIELVGAYDGACNTAALMKVLPELEHQLPPELVSLAHLPLAGRVALAQCYLGKFTEAKRLAEEGLLLCDRYGYSALQVTDFHIALQNFYFSAGAFGAALKHATAVESLCRVDFKFGYAMVCVLKSKLFALSGNRAAAMEYAGYAKSAVSHNGGAPTDAAGQIALYADVYAALATRRYEDAESILLKLLAALRKTPSKVPSESGENLSESGENLSESGENPSESGGQRAECLLHLAFLFTEAHGNDAKKLAVYTKDLLELIAARQDLYDYALIKLNAEMSSAVLGEALRHPALTGFERDLSVLTELIASHRRETAEQLHGVEAFVAEQAELHVGAVKGTGKLPAIEIQTFGTFRVRVRGRELSRENWQRKKARDVFKFLLLNYQRAVTVDELWDAVWDDDAPRSSDLIIAKAASHIRKAFEPDAGTVELTDEATETDGVTGKPSVKKQSETVGQAGVIKNRDKSYTLDFGSAARIDFLEFKRCIAQTTQGAASDLERRTLYEQAVALYAGDFLQQDAAEWIAFERGALKDAYIAACAWLAESHLTGGNATAGAVFAEKILAADRTDERGYELLLLSLRQQNRWNDARKVYERCKAVFKKEFGTTPPAKLTEFMKYSGEIKNT